MERSRDAAASSFETMRDMAWSRVEKEIARKVFDRALQREMEEVIVEAKKRAARIQQPSELWELENFLTERRRQIDHQYDYRYSVLPLVFGNLIRQGRIGEQELSGLGEDKFSLIRHFAKA